MAGTAPVRVLRFIVIYELTSTAEWFWSGASQPRYGATATLGCRLEGDRVIIGFGGWGIKDEDIPRSPERIKDFHRDLPVAPRGTHAPEWYCELVDALSADGGWEDSKFEAYYISERPSGSSIRFPSLESHIAPDRILYAGQVP